MSADPTAEHIDAVARVAAGLLDDFDTVMNVRLESFEIARRLLASTDPAVHAAFAASLPTQVMLAALVDRGTLTERFAIRDEGGSVWLDAHGDHREAKPGGLEFADRGDAEGIVARPHEEVVRRRVTPWEVAP